MVTAVLPLHFTINQIQHIRMLRADALERGEQFARRKELYEAKYPLTKAGKAQALGLNKSQGNDVSADSALTFVKDTSAKTKQSTRTISEDVQIASRIPEQVRDAIRETPIYNAVS